MAVTGDNEYLYDPMTIGETKPLIMDLMDSAPGAITTSLWNMGRVRNTIIGGPVGRYSNRVPGVRQTKNAIRKTRNLNRQAANKIKGVMPDRISKHLRTRPMLTGAEGGGGFIRQGTTQTFGPRHFRRFSRAANIDPTFYGEHSKIYSPFNILSSIGNKLYGMKDRIAKMPIIGENIAGKMAEAAGEGPISKGEKMFSPGTLGRIRASDSIIDMGARRYGKSFKNAWSAIQDINPEVYARHAASYADAFAGGKMSLMESRFRTVGAMGETITSRVSGRAAGYIAGARASGAGDEAIKGILGGIDKESRFGQGVMRGLEAAAKSAEAGGGGFAGFVAKGGLATTMRAASVVGNVLLVHDLAEMGGKLIGRGLTTAADAAKDLRGDLGKDIMGMGFKDNTVAATSRQRGVMAIQNSRLNARSYLGSEAAAMHAHFG